MAAASAVAHSRHRGPVVVVGTDLPTLTAAMITEAIGRVDAGCDVVFGPAVDGGYYLVALAGPAPQLFALPPRLWGGSDVLAASMALAAAEGLRIAQLAPLRDLDTPADLAAFVDEGRLPAPVAAAVSGVQPVVESAVRPVDRTPVTTRPRSVSSSMGPSHVDAPAPSRSVSMLDQLPPPWLISGRQRVALARRVP